MMRTIRTHLFQYHSRTAILLACVAFATVLVACDEKPAGPKETPTPSVESLVLREMATAVAAQPTANDRLLSSYLSEHKRLLDAAITESEIANRMPWDTPSQITAYESQLRKVRSINNEIRALVPPPCLIDAHRSLVLATLQNDRAHDQTVSGLRQKNTALLNEATNQTLQVTAEFNKAANLMKTTDVASCH